MLSTEMNVDPASDYFLFTASDVVKQMFFYPICTGEFVYRPHYQLTRERYDSFLLMCVQEGECSITIQHKTYTAKSGDVVLIDCYKPHSYTTTAGWKALWLHFDGPLARIQCEHLLQSFGPVITPRNYEGLEHTMKKILNTFRTKSIVHSSSMSKYITSMMNELFLSGSKKVIKSRSSLKLEKTIAYINEHYSEQICLEDLANQSSLSPYYFTRIFTKETGLTPYQYIISTRVNSAKFLLMNSTLSIKEIAFSSGFTSESVFCSSFKKRENLTPSEYRMMNLD